MTKRPGSKSIIASFGALSTALPDEPEATSGTSDVSSKPVGRVGAGIIGATQRSLAEIREERDRLLALVEHGGAVQELDPELIEPSPFPDRLPDDSDEAFEEFKRRFAAEGQKVPIQLRLHPTLVGRYQVIYGHRRWRAALELGCKVRAIIGDFSDTELVLAQGIENSDRQDLSWIERALFVARMDNQGIKPREVKASLSIDDAELAKLRQVGRAVPVDIIEAIGRAPKVGRPRWLSFAAALGDEGALARVREALSADKGSSSNDRFRSALAATKTSVPFAFGQEVVDLRDSSGGLVGKAEFSRGEVRVKMAKSSGAAFASFLRSELPRLVEQFELANAAKDGKPETLSSDKVSDDQ